ncbi:MAG: sugar transferase [Chloroflexi bacterium]|nr:sugar transferase [Chloroflexota bacterium]
MKHERPNKYVLTLYISDVLATVLSLSLAEWLRQTLPYGQPFDAYWGGLNWGIYLVAIAIWTIAFRQLSAYDANRILRVADEVQTVLAAVGMSTLLLAGALYLSYRGLSRLLFVYFLLLDILIILLFRAVVRLVFKGLEGRRATEQRILLVGAGEVGRQMAALLDERRWMGLQVVGFLDDDPQKMGQLVGGFPVFGTLDEAPELVTKHGIQEVIITLPLYAHKRLEELVSLLNETPVNVSVVPDFFSLAYLRTSIGILGDIPLVTLKEPAIGGFALLAKRMLDFVVAACALLLLWPAMLVIALLIKLDSPGPVIFKQQRVGWHGGLFWMYKFRTMVADADSKINVIMARTERGRRYMRKDSADPRITRVGRYLRRWSLDELPQLFNVLKGEMSLVGPRPELPLLVQDYEPWQRKRLSVPPGITGWWQVTGRADQPLALHTEADLYYIRNCSLLLDLQILLRTISAVIKGKGAY